MKMSTKGRYGVMAMIDIATHSAGLPVSLAEIAERQDISQEYLEQLFGKLRKARLVESARGPGGGYRLARPAAEVMVAEIVEAVDEPLRVTRCDGDAVEGCVKGERCCAHDLWSSLGRQMMHFLASITLEDVVEKRNLALAASIKQAKDRYRRVER
jgi:Rrf2 family iron-sulfur cluster assembly transcriptional regulator